MIESLVSENEKSILKTGMVFKNWHDLCDQFGWQRTINPNSRKAQEKDLNTVCKWHKQGHKIIIDEVYEVAKERENNRFDKDLKELRETIERQIIREMAKESRAAKEAGKNIFYSSSLNLTLNQWMERLGLINDNYKKAVVNSNVMAYLLDVNKTLLNDVVVHSKSAVNKWLRDSFKSLQGKRIALDIRDSYVLMVNDKMGSYRFVDAQPEHSRIIRECEGRVLDRNGIKSVSHILNGSSKEKFTIARFYYEVQKEIREFAIRKFEILDDDIANDLMNISRYYSTINVDFTPFRIEDKEREAEQFLEYDKEVMERFFNSDLGEMTNQEFTESFIYAIELLDDVKEYISNKTVDRLSNNTCKRLCNRELQYTDEQIYDATSKLHSLNTEIIPDSYFNEFNCMWGSKMPDFNDSEII